LFKVAQLVKGKIEYSERVEASLRSPGSRVGRDSEPIGSHRTHFLKACLFSTDS